MHTRQDQTSRHPRHGEEFQIPQPHCPARDGSDDLPDKNGGLPGEASELTHHSALPCLTLRKDIPWPFSPRRGCGDPGETEAGKGILDAGCSDLTDQVIEARRGEGHPGSVSPMGRTGLLGVAWAVTGALSS